MRSPKFLAFRNRILNNLDTEINHFHEAFVRIIKYRKWLLIVIIFTTHMLFLNKYLMGYIIALSLGQSVPFDRFLGLQIIQMFLIYFAPTPGASGVAELSSVGLMAKLISDSVLMVYTLIWRFASTVLGAAIGGVVLLLDMRFWTRHNLKVSSKKIPSTSANNGDKSME